MTTGPRSPARLFLHDTAAALRMTAWWGAPLLAGALWAATAVSGLAALAWLTAALWIPYAVHEAAHLAAYRAGADDTPSGDGAGTGLSALVRNGPGLKVVTDPLDWRTARTVAAAGPLTGIAAAALLILPAWATGPASFAALVTCAALAAQAVNLLPGTSDGQHIWRTR